VELEVHQLLVLLVVHLPLVLSALQLVAEVVQTLPPPELLVLEVVVIEIKQVAGL
jgi:hypothetical protein